MNIIKWFNHQRIRYTLKHHPIPFELWETVIHDMDLLQGLSSVEKAHLRELATRFLHQKTINGVQGLAVSPEMAVTIAAQASLLILKLDLDYYQNWVEVILYPSAFRVEHEQMNSVGLINRESQAVSGEAWLRGPVILSWQDIEQDLNSLHPGHNVVVHEFAHKLDMLTGSANGLPPLPVRMATKRWAKVLGDAFEILQRQVTYRRHTRINAYGATSPAEFFAVVSEYFFTAPGILQQHCPDVYQQLQLFYQQDPSARRDATHSL